jgi:hypothetical protein
MKGSNFDPEIDLYQSNATKSRHDEADLKQFERDHHARAPAGTVGSTPGGGMTGLADEKNGQQAAFPARLGINPRSAAAAW